ncbi:S8 family serine peptidase [Streptomyces sp. 4N509B]|uniref:S8 family serine peptidase n=1 Tax=Streptomyces sp. 4N509B TaxID=3457413 RepID=UPI003FD4CBE0
MERSRSGHRRAWRTRLAAAMTTGTLAAGVAVASPAALAEAADATGVGGAAHTHGAPVPTGRTDTVRLVTGDTVTVTSTADGRRTVSVTPGEGRDGLAFQTIDHDGALTVLPSDVEPLFVAGHIDPALFDVTGLVERGLDTAHADALPLLVFHPEGVSAAAAEDSVDALASLRDTEAPSFSLESIGATSMAVDDEDLGDFWEALHAPARPSARNLGATPRLWLDAPVSAQLDRSTGQVNAPAAWEAGLDGSGVRVAVLDTGADPEHPDLAGRITAAEDFTGSGGTHDAVGHGTHVAATVAGTGAGGEGGRQGMAPGAEVLVGKVLGDTGSGSTSQVIAGMEWAAEQGSDVVTMSLGSDEPSDGTDPLSLAVNELTASTDTLFVVAAGNNGAAGEGTIGSPAAADAALTVGAVDREDVLAPFSSRGPRYGDAAVKPDLTAPGVGIVAARAAGTSMGTPVDALYTAASGTSMATPHVAGAAVLLAQAHPEWDAELLKSALVSTAHTVDGAAVTEQGGGRLDVAAALAGPLVASGTVALGPFETGDGAGQAETETLRYTNTVDEPVTLRLAASLTTDDGEPLPEGAVSLAAAEVTVEPGKTAEVPLTADPTGVPHGAYYGYVTATTDDGEVVAHTTVSLVVQPPSHRLDVTITGPDGEPVTWAMPLFWGPAGFVSFRREGPGRVSAEVPEGTYLGREFGQHMGEDELPQYRMAVLPEVRVTEDTAVTLDLRVATPVEIRTPRPTDYRGWLVFQLHRELDGHAFLNTVQYPHGARLWVSPTEPVTEGSFEFASRWHLAAPLLDARVPGARDLALDPYYSSYSPLMAPGRLRQTLVAVDAGSVEEPDFSRAEGRLAVLRGEGFLWDLAEQAAEAGVAALLLVRDDDGSAVTPWHPNGDRYATPIARVTAAHGAALLERIAQRRTTVEFTGDARGSYAYDVLQVSRGHIPERVVHTVTEDNTARVRTSYARLGATDQLPTHRVAWRPYQDTTVVGPPVWAPSAWERTEYVSTGAPGTTGEAVWQRFVHYTMPWLVDAPVDGAAMRDRPRSYEVGQRVTQEWLGAVVRPAIPAGGQLVSERAGNMMTLRVPEFADAGAAAGQWSSGGTADGALYREGEHLGASDGGFGSFEVPAGEAAYRFDLTTSRSNADWTFGTRTDTSWSFTSEATSEAAPLPLLQLDYALRAGLDNAVDAGGRHTLGVSVRHQDGLAPPEGVEVRVEASYDDGESFSPAVRLRPVGGEGTAFEATIERPRDVRGDAYVTLRVTASDAAGNEVRQTVTRAYADLD